MNDKLKNIFLIILGILLAASLAVSIIYYEKYNKSCSEIAILNDSTYYYKNKCDQEYIAKNTYILKAKQLKEYNDSLYAEYMNLKEHPVIITKTKIVTKIDTIRASVDSLWDNDSLVAWAWSAKDSCWYEIHGSSRIIFSADTPVVQTDIETIIMNNQLTLDLIDNDQNLSVIARTSNPYMKITDVQSVVIDPEKSQALKNHFKPKRWGFGPYVGLGFYGGYGGNVKNSIFSSGVQLGVGFSIGFSVHYDLIQW